MKSKTLPVKRRPASKGIFRRLSAVTFNRKQRVSASATGAAMEADDGSSKISRALIIIFLIPIAVEHMSSILLKVDMVSKVVIEEAYPVW